MQTVNTYEYAIERFAHPDNPQSTWRNPYRYAKKAWTPPPFSQREYSPTDEQDTIAELIKVIWRVVDRGLDYSHAWHVDLQQRFKLHPCIKDAVRQAPPRDRWQLVFEWPHVSETDPNRLAYTRDERAGQDNRQTITSVGKYLRRHFPTLTDNQLRDIAMRHTGFTYALWSDPHDIIKSVQEGPDSCMQWGCEVDYDDHPYRAYAPSYGWRAAVRLDNSGNIVGRCLVNVSGTDKIFVRSYARKQDGYSHSDEALEVWLRDQGFEKHNSWEGLRLAYIDGEDPFLAPYLDGDVKRVDIRRDNWGQYLYITCDGDYDCSNTDGTPEFIGVDCERCGSHGREDDMHWVGQHEDTRVCESCLSDDYVYAYGRGGNQYYILHENAIYCDYDDEWYSSRYLADNNMVRLDDGEICPSDDAVYLERRGIYVHQDDCCAVYCEHDGTYEHSDDVVELHDDTWAYEGNAWQCEVSNYYYHDNDKNCAVEFSCVLLCKHMVAHEDNIDEQYGVDLDAAAEATAALIALI